MKIQRMTGLICLLMGFVKPLAFCQTAEQEYFDRAKAAHAKGSYDEAIADYTKVIELNPTAYEAYKNRGVNYELKGRLDQAIADYTKLIELNPRDAEAYIRRADAYFDKQEFDQYESDRKKAIELGSRRIGLTPQQKARLLSVYQEMVERGEAPKTGACIIFVPFPCTNLEKCAIASPPDHYAGAPRFYCRDVSCRTEGKRSYHYNAI